MQTTLSMRGCSWSDVQTVCFTAPCGSHSRHKGFLSLFLTAFWYPSTRMNKLIDVNWRTDSEAACEHYVIVNDFVFLAQAFILIA